jgi:hypothetical protein
MTLTARTGSSAGAGLEQPDSTQTASNSEIHIEKCFRTMSVTCKVRSGVESGQIFNDRLVSNLLYEKKGVKRQGKITP